MLKLVCQRSVIGLMAFAIASTSWAEANANFKPCIRSFFIGADAEYLRPQNADLDYVTLNSAFRGPTLKSISTRYKWSGWRVYLGVTMDDHDDLTFSWLHFDRGYSDSQGASSLFPRWLSTVNGTTPIFWNQASGKASFTIDEAYMVWGHTIYFNNPWRLRYAGGLEFANLFQNLRVVGSVPEESAAYLNKNHMEGWGPRIELDVAYRFPWHFKGFFRTNAALLAAARKMELEDEALDPDPTFILYDQNADVRKVVIPKLGMKVGLGWSYYVSQGLACGSTWTIELGWQADVYIHAIERPDESYILLADAPVPFTPASIGHTNVSNFSDQGVFLGLKINANWM